MCIRDRFRGVASYEIRVCSIAPTTRRNVWETPCYDISYLTQKRHVVSLLPGMLLFKIAIHESTHGRKKRETSRCGAKVTDTHNSSLLRKFFPLEVFFVTICRSRVESQWHDTSLPPPSTSIEKQAWWGEMASRFLETNNFIWKSMRKNNSATFLVGGSAFSFKNNNCSSTMPVAGDLGLWGTDHKKKSRNSYWGNWRFEFLNRWYVLSCWNYPSPLRKFFQNGYRLKHAVFSLSNFHGAPWKRNIGKLS